MFRFFEEEFPTTDRILEYQLDVWEELGYPPTHQYVLSRGGVLPEDNLTLSPWVRQFVGLSAESAQELLRQRWAKFAGGPCENLAEYMLRFLPYSIATWSDQCWLVCRSEPTESTSARALILTDPVAIDFVTEQMSSHGIASDVFTQVAMVLCGLRQLLPPNAGYFFMKSNNDTWQHLDDSFIDELNEPTWRKNKWRGGIIIFSSLSGEGLARNTLGSYAWVGSDLKIRTFAEDDLTFIKALHVFHTRGAGFNGWPFDAYTSLDATYLYREPGE